MNKITVNIMDINALREILNRPDADPDDILNFIATEPDAIQSVVKMMDMREAGYRALVKNAGLLLGQCLAIIEQPKLNRNGFIHDVVQMWYESAGLRNPFKQ